MVLFTKTYEEKHRGVELLCDTCNKFPELNTDTWYYRSNLFDKYPSMWLCNTCKESMT